MSIALTPRHFQYSLTLEKAAFNTLGIVGLFIFTILFFTLVIPAYFVYMSFLFLKFRRETRSLYKSLNTLSDRELVEEEFELRELMDLLNSIDEKRKEHKVGVVGNLLFQPLRWFSKEGKRVHEPLVSLAYPHHGMQPDISRIEELAKKYPHLLDL